MATVAPFIVPRRTSSSTAATTSAADERGPQRRVDRVGACRQRLRRQPEGIEERGRADDSDEHVDEDGRARTVIVRSGAAAPGRSRATSSMVWRPAASTSATVRNGGSTRSTCGANSDPASTSRAGPSATTSPSPSTSARVAHCAASSTSCVASTTAPPPLAWRSIASMERAAETTRPCPASARRAAAPVRLRPRRRRSRPADARRRPALRGWRAARWVRWRASSQWSTASSSLRAEQAERLLEFATHGGGEQQRVRVLGHVRDRGETRRPRRGDGSRRPARARSSVVLPAPLRPRRAITSPAQHVDVCGPQRDTSAELHFEPACGDEWLAADGGRVNRGLARSRHRDGRGKRVGPRVAHGQGQRMPAEQAAERHDRRRAGVLGQHRPRIARGDHSSIFDARHVVRERCRAVEAVLGEHHGGAEVGVEAGQRRQHVVGALRIELRRRLVEHDRRRRRRECTGDRDPLLLAARERARGAVAEVRDRRARRALPRLDAASPARSSRGSRARRRRHARRGRPRTGPRDPGRRTR